MRTLPATMGLKEMARLGNMSRRTMQRYLHDRAITCEGRRVMMIDIKENWPRFYASLAIAYEQPAPLCPDCGEMTERACVMCSFKAA